MSKHGAGDRRATDSKHRRHRRTAANRRSERGEEIRVRAESSMRGREAERLRPETESVNANARGWG